MEQGSDRICPIGSFFFAGGRRAGRSRGQAAGGAVPRRPLDSAGFRAVADVLRHGLPNLGLSYHRVSNRRT